MVFVVIIIREINSMAEPGNDNIITSTQQPRRRRSNWEQLNIRRPYKTRDTAAIAAAAAAVVQWYKRKTVRSHSCAVLENSSQFISS